MKSSKDAVPLFNMPNLHVKGIELLGESEKHELEKISRKNIEKIKRMIDNDFLLKIVIRVNSKSKENKEKRKRYSITIEISGEIPRIEASDEEWDFNKAINNVFQKLSIEIEHKFHLMDKH